MSRFGNQRRLLSALVAQIAFMSPLVQIAEARRLKRSCERFPNALTRSDLGPVRRQRERRIRTQERGNLLGFRFVNIQLVCQERGVGLLETRPHLFPGQSLLRARSQAAAE